MGKSITIDNRLLFASVEDCVQNGQSVTIQVKGTSMRPYLRSARDKVELGPVAPQELVPGAVVLFRYRSNYVMHRIRCVDGENLTIQGDGLLFSQEKATKSDVVAIVRNIIRVARSGKERVMPCNSKRWRRLSRLWLTTPRLIKRVILHFA